jgi:hypothetical protein
MTTSILHTLQRGGILKFSPHSQAFYVVHHHQEHHADQAEAKRLVKREIVRPNGIDPGGRYVFALNPAQIPQQEGRKK